MSIKMKTFYKKHIAGNSNAGLLLALIVVFAIFSYGGEYFLTAYNLVNVLKNTSVLAVVAIGSTLAILSAHNDLSVGSVMSLSGVVCAVMMQSGVPTGIAILGGLASGAACGLVNGVLIGYVKADYWIVTFAMMSVAAGVALVVSGGNTTSSFPDAFRALSKDGIFGINGLILIALACAVIMLFVLRKTKFGYDVYAVGDSATCAELSGIHVKRTKMLLFTLGGFFAGVAGIMLTAKSNAALPTSGVGYEFDAIAATYIGGTAGTGGKGGYFGTILGALLITVIRNGLSMIGVPSLWQYLLIGIIILLVIVYGITKDRIDVMKKNERRYVDA